MEKKKIIILTSFFALVLLIGFFWMTGSTEDSLDVIIKPTRGEFLVTVTATGELQAKNSIDIMGPLNARMAGIWQMKIANLVAEGTVVKTGDFVAELDKSEITNKIQDMEAEILKAESRYTQTKLDTTLTLSQARDELVNLKYAMEEQQLKMEQSAYEAPSVRRQAEIDYEKAKRRFEQETNNYQTKVEQSIARMKEVEADLSQYQNKLATLQRVMGQFTVLAPADGMVIYAKEWDGKKKVVNSTISGWDPTVATLPDLSRMESITYVNEVDIQKVSKDLKVNIELDADPDKKLTGVVTEIANIGEQRPNSDSKVFEVTIEINEADSTLRPAMTTSNEIIVTTLKNALYIPLECVHTEDSLTFVYKKEGLSVVKQEVKLGQMNDNEVTIKTGLDENNEIYLSLPAETKNLEIVRLPESDVAYRKQE